MTQETKNWWKENTHWIAPGVASVLFTFFCAYVILYGDNRWEKRADFELSVKERNMKFEQIGRDISDFKTGQAVTHSLLETQILALDRLSRRVDRTLDKYPEKP